MKKATLNEKHSSIAISLENIAEIYAKKE